MLKVNKPFVLLGLRWLTAGVLGFGAFRILIWTTRASGLAGGFAGAIVGFSVLISSVLLLAPELASWAAAPIHRAINSLIFPGGSVIPPADYTLARLYRKQWRYRESVEEYFKILEYHPQELAAYLEGIATATEAKAPKTRERFLRLGLRKLKDDDACATLRRAFEAARAG